MSEKLNELFRQREAIVAEYAAAMKRGCSIQESFAFQARLAPIEGQIWENGGIV